MGDLHQLPPIEQETHGYFFQSCDFRSFYDNLLRVDLTVVKRTDDEQLLTTQLLIRDRKVTPKELANYVKEVDRSQTAIYLCSKNSEVDKINDEEVKKV
jgi:hypothetical protein